MRKIFLASLLLATLTLTGCSTSKKTDAIDKTSVMQGEKIKFELVKNYFFRNDAEIPTSPLVTSQEQFDSLFGAAAFMGKDGMPTKVDFDKQSVIAVVKPSSTTSLSLSPLHVYKNGNDVIFTYKNAVGGDQGFYTQPILLIVVDKSDVDGCTVSLQEERSNKK